MRVHSASPSGALSSRLRCPPGAPATCHAPEVAHGLPPADGLRLPAPSGQHGGLCVALPRLCAHRHPRWLDRPPARPGEPHRQRARWLARQGGACQRRLDPRKRRADAQRVDGLLVLARAHPRADGDLAHRPLLPRRGGPPRGHRGGQGHGLAAGRGDGGGGAGPAEPGRALGTSGASCATCRPCRSACNRALRRNFSGLRAGNGRGCFAFTRGQRRLGSPRRRRGRWRQGRRRKCRQSKP
jgi:hypothetical protein